MLVGSGLFLIFKVDERGNPLSFFREKWYDKEEHIKRLFLIPAMAMREGPLKLFDFMLEYGAYPFN